MKKNINEFLFNLEKLTSLLTKTIVNKPLSGFLFSDNEFDQLVIITHQLINNSLSLPKNISILFLPKHPISILQTFINYEVNNNWLKPRKYFTFLFGFESSSIGGFLKTIQSNLSHFKLDSNSLISLNIELIDLFFKSKNKSSDGGSCYIATLVFNSYDSKEVLVLRNFRDKILLRSKYGTKFVRWYYSKGPKIVLVLKNKHFINGLVKITLKIITRILVLVGLKGIKIPEK